MYITLSLAVIALDSDFEHQSPSRFFREGDYFCLKERVIYFVPAQNSQSVYPSLSSLLTVDSLFSLFTVGQCPQFLV